MIRKVPSILSESVSKLIPVLALLVPPRMSPLVSYFYCCLNFSKSCSFPKYFISLSSFPGTNYFIKPGDVAPTWLVRYFTTAAGGASQRASGGRSATEDLGSPTRVRIRVDWKTGNVQGWEVGWVRRGEGSFHPPRLFSGWYMSCFSSNRWKGQFCCSAPSTEEPDWAVVHRVARSWTRLKRLT